MFLKVLKKFCSRLYLPRVSSLSFLKFVIVLDLGCEKETLEFLQFSKTEQYLNFEKKKKKTARDWQGKRFTL